MVMSPEGARHEFSGRWRHVVAASLGPDDAGLRQATADASPAERLLDRSSNGPMSPRTQRIFFSHNNARARRNSGLGGPARTVPCRAPGSTALASSFCRTAKEVGADRSK